MERRTGGEELRRIYYDVLVSGRELGVQLPVLEPLETFVASLSIE